MILNNTNQFSLDKNEIGFSKPKIIIVYENFLVVKSHQFSK